MSLNTYLDRDSAERLKRLARERKMPCSGLLREAVQMLLDRSTTAWPKEVLEFKGEPSLAPFESYRVELASDRANLQVRPQRQASRHRGREPEGPG